MAIGRSNISQQVMKPPTKKKNNKKIRNKPMLNISGTTSQKKKARRP